jgi:hypothetical protein
VPDDWVGARHRADPAAGTGKYLINTAENHSEVHGPYAAWRRQLTARVNRARGALDGAIAGRFGISLDQIRTLSGRFFAQHESAWPEQRAETWLLRAPLDAGASATRRAPHSA